MYFYLITDKNDEVTLVHNKVFVKDEIEDFIKQAKEDFKNIYPNRKITIHDVEDFLVDNENFWKWDYEFTVDVNKI